MGVFERLLGSLECPKAPLVHWQVAFPNSNGGIRLISCEVIALIAYPMLIKNLLKQSIIKK
jgi:hypothetical protein